jgi:pimeloyl-ACP methyl ester carboxylesterase
MNSPLRSSTFLVSLLLLAVLSSAVCAGEPAPLAKYLEYPSTHDPDVHLFAKFSCLGATGVLLVKMHGWHGQVKSSSPDNISDSVTRGYFVIEPEMRGRGDSTGNPDCNGWELQDVVDSIAFARSHYHDRITSPNVVLLWGGSGGGGNAYALLGKFPDLFSAARITSGISDYALWYNDDAKGEFRDEMEGPLPSTSPGHKPWIGGNPKNNAEAYLSRGGLETVRNLLTPTLIFHGETDIRVPSAQARLWVGAAHGQGHGALVTYHETAGVGDAHNHFSHITADQRAFYAQTGAQFLATHRTPPQLPQRGSLVVAGYVKTARFEVTLDSIAHVGRVDYDLDAGKFDVRAPSAKSAVLRVRSAGGEWKQSFVACRP